MSLIMKINQDQDSICGFSEICKGFNKEKLICHIGTETTKRLYCKLYREMYHFINISQIDVGLQEFDYELKSKLAGP